MEGVKITPFLCYFNSRLGVKSAVNVFVHERGYPVPKIFTPLLELK